MDLSQFDILEASEGGFTYTVKVPFGENKGEDSDIKIEVLGVFSKAFEDANAQIQAYQEKCWTKGKTPDKAHLEKLNVGLLVACTKGWSGMKDKGKDLPFSKENAQYAYEKYPWLAKQVGDAAADMESMLEKK